MRSSGVFERRKDEWAREKQHQSERTHIIPASLKCQWVLAQPIVCLALGACLIRYYQLVLTEPL